VWVEDGASLCQTLLFDPDAREKARSKKARKAKEKRKAKARRKKSPSRKPRLRLPKGIARGIEKVGPREFHVDRRAVDSILENQSRLMRSARLIPERKNGETLGIRLFGIRKKTLLAKLGFKNGDRLEAINGFDMTSPETALKAYARLRTAQHLTVEISRRGQDVHLEYLIN
jgi:general secretion pathway protein C